jgi:2-(3-amino-3-carboxypropyl)histidine synthase
MSLTAAELSILQERVAAELPSRYDFDIASCVIFLRSGVATASGASRPVRVVGIQFPEGLVPYSLPISDILEDFCDVIPVVFADAVYGACCVDDIGARYLDCDAFIHFGHTQLVASTILTLPTLHIPVHISFDVAALAAATRAATESDDAPTGSLAILSTGQFVPSAAVLCGLLAADLPPHTTHVYLPHAGPRLRPSELLGCTLPPLRLDTTRAVVLGDGRFHLEAVGLAAPSVTVHAYDVYAQTLLRETLAQPEVARGRRSVLSAARDALTSAKPTEGPCDNAVTVGFVLGTLGRQGSLPALEGLRTVVASYNAKVASNPSSGFRPVRALELLLAEIFPARLSLISPGSSACSKHPAPASRTQHQLPGKRNAPQIWVELACPRLAIDWGVDGFVDRTVPFLTPEEFCALLGVPSAGRVSRVGPADAAITTPSHVSACGSAGFGCDCDAGADADFEDYGVGGIRLDNYGSRPSDDRAAAPWVSVAADE